MFNKSDLISVADLHALQQEFALSAPHNLHVTTQFGNIDLDLVIGTPTTGTIEQINRVIKPELAGFSDRFETTSVRLGRSVSRTSLETWAKSIVGTCYRAKGIVRLDSDNNKLFLFNLVGTRYSLEPVNIDLKADQFEIVMIALKNKKLTKKSILA